eukprot:CAMPEP_0119034942 /NCGR_PEP_ID=MMETSP1177-20130426/1951_1 /TAXON_ID=2985 /ORGANISM="Ochromonas sp, Strain CCMP1899" /LENGTH=697 /DNA_ID=CAMNT_0006992781 /DNA_START=93 /DNA_END=2183 /DNA_ORIENTATION=+
MEDDFSSIFCDNLFEGDDDHWLFEQPLSNSLDIPLQSIDDDSLSIPQPSPLLFPIKTEYFPSSSDGSSVNKEILNASSIHSTENSSGRYGNFNSDLKEGLTEFVPWTGFDYSSDGEVEDDDHEETTGGSKKKRKRVKIKQPNPDADVIASATGDNLKKLGIDPNSNEGKKQMRKIRNRLSAQFHRERKKGYITYLENLVRERDAKLSLASTHMQQVIQENEKLLMHIEIESKHSDIEDFSSIATAAGHTDSDTGDDSDTILSSPPNSPMSSFSTGTHFSGSRIGSTISLFSAIVMISLTMFGPSLQPNSFDPEETSQMNHRKLSILPSENSLDKSSSFDFIQSPEARDTVSSLTAIKAAKDKRSLIATHERNLLSSSASLSQDMDDFIRRSENVNKNAYPSNQHLLPQFPATDVMSVLVPPSNDRFILRPESLTDNNQHLWKYQDHIADIYPPFHMISNQEEQSTNISKAKGNLRTRYNQKDTVESSPVKESNGLLQRYVPPGEYQKESHDHSWGEQIWTTAQDMGKGLVPSHLQEPMSHTESDRHSKPQPSIDWSSSPSLKPTSVSRVLLTQGRALLDPSLVSPLVPQPNVVRRESDYTDTFLKALTTNQHSSGPSPVFRMGGNDMGTSPVESPDSNVLVMLLPASKVRWGKDWGRSSEGSMEAMLNGLNFTDYSNHDDKSRGEIPSDSAVQDDMW